MAAFKSRRQHPIGRFVVDFACTRHHLVIEADGGQHTDREADAERTKWLEGQGWRVLRFWNNDILANTEGVLETILVHRYHETDRITQNRRMGERSSTHHRALISSVHLTLFERRNRCRSMETLY